MSCASASRTRGFTLTECCVALAIATAMIMVAAPSFRDGIERRELLGRSAELQADLQWLRTEAVARQQAVGITLGHEAAGDCYVLHTGMTGSCTCRVDAPPSCDAPARPVKHVDLPARGPVRLSASTAGASFHPVRGNVTPMTTLNLSDPHGREVRHVVSALGRVRTCAAPAATAGLAAC